MHTGVVSSGLGIATDEHEQGDWSEFGYQPRPGTLNLTVDPSVADWLEQRPAAVWHADRHQHMRTFYPAHINGHPCHLRINNDRTQVEAVAAVHLRTVLGLNDDDEVTLT
jgi:CTP-dependent riboflavin kinase